MRSSLRRHCLYGIVLLLLSACGGGGSSDSSVTGLTTPGATTAEGQFIDSAVSGLTYICGDIIGTTDEYGTFIYHIDQEVTFMVGGVIIGTAQGASFITPIDLVAGAEDETDATVINILRFLQSLDDDADPDNGINITAEVISALENASINFNVTVDVFSSDSELLTLLNSLPTFIDGTLRYLLPEYAVLEHFRATLEDIEGYDLSEMIQITQEEFENFGGEGVWRSIGNISGTFSYGGMVTSGIMKQVTAMAEKTVDGQRYYDSCYLGGFSLAESEETADEDTACEGGTISYYKSQDGETAYLSLACDGSGTNIYEFTMLSGTPEFDLGSASVSFSSGYPSVSTSDGICGEISDIEQQVTTELLGTEISSEVSEHQINFRVPYRDNYLYFILAFATQPSVGEYTVVERFDEELEGEVGISITSASATIFAANLDEHYTFASVSGTLTLNTLTETRASGSFDILTRADNNINESIAGEFNLAVE